MVRAEIIERQKEISKTPPLDRIAAMKESLAAAGDEAQQLRHLPAWASKDMADQGLYRFALPTELGGENLRAREQIEIIEAVSAIDGSVGWCTQISSEINALVIRRMDPTSGRQNLRRLGCASVFWTRSRQWSQPGTRRPTRWRRLALELPGLIREWLPKRELELPNGRNDYRRDHRPTSAGILYGASRRIRDYRQLGYSGNARFWQPRRADD